MKKYRQAWRNLLRKAKNKMEPEKDELISEGLVEEDLDSDIEVELDDLPV